MNFIVVGTNHKVCPIEIREKLSFSRKSLAESLVKFMAHTGIKAGVILSTCNRIELYAHAANTGQGVKSLKKFILDYRGGNLPDIEPYLYTYIGKQAIAHLFQVASGLDSQIIGEEQILEQGASSFRRARLVEATNSLTDMIFEAGLITAKEVKEKTAISLGNINIASIALALIKTKFESLDEKKILIIGLGKISELILGCLKPEKPRAVFISNRNYAKARLIAQDLGAQALKFEHLKENLGDTDIIISTTSSPHVIIRKEDIQKAMSYKLSTINHKLLIIDLAVPRDVDPQVKEIEGVELYCLDDLGFIIEKNLEKRKEAVPQALGVIEEKVDALWRELTELAPELAILP